MPCCVRYGWPAMSQDQAVNCGRPEGRYSEGLVHRRPAPLGRKRSARPHSANVRSQPQADIRHAMWQHLTRACHHAWLTH
jgi:hypothetical protein